MASLRLDRLRFSFPDGPPVVDNVSLELNAGEFFCLLGPSGSGKSTLLRLVGGYLLPAEGRVALDGRDVTRLSADRRQMGMVFQNYALFPHLDAVGNVAFGLRVRGMPRAAREKKAREMLDWVGLAPAECNRRPAQLSGGQQQRVALARALVFEPGLLMLDEPFASLDRNLRERLREELREIQQRLKITTILVTHDRDEALSLCDRMGVMQRGRLVQTGTPLEVYRQPRGASVATFLGHRNVLAPADARRCGLDGHVLLWPQKLRLNVAGALAGAISRFTFAGSHLALTVKLDAGPELSVHVSPDDEYRVGERTTLEIPAEAVTALTNDGE